MNKTDNILTSKYILTSRILVLGNFNPTIFHPEWFDRYKILPAQETQPLITIEHHKIQKSDKLEEAKIIVTPMFSKIEFPSLTIEIDQSRFEALANKSVNYFVLSQTVIKIFYLLSHTPVRRLRFSFNTHLLFDIDSDTILNDLLTSKSTKLKEVLGPNVKLGGHFEIEEENYIFNLLLEKSNKLDDGIYFRFNFDHKINDTDELRRLIDSNFGSYFQKSEQTILKLCGTPKGRLGDD